MVNHPQHKHMIVRAEVARPFRYEDQGRAGEWLAGLVTKIGMKIIGGPYVAFATAPGNTGITACVLIETSHVSLHVWDADEPPLVQLDVYTCSDLNPAVVLEELKVMEPFRVEYKYLDREEGLKLLDDVCVGYGVPPRKNCRAREELGAGAVDTACSSGHG